MYYNIPYCTGKVNVCVQFICIKFKLEKVTKILLTLVDALKCNCRPREFLRLG